MKQSIIGAIVAGLVLFLWGFLYWGLNPLPYTAWSQPTNDAALGESLKQFLPDSGMYYVPGPHLGEDEATRLLGGPRSEYERPDRSRSSPSRGKVCP